MSSTVSELIFLQQFKDDSLNFPDLFKDTNINEVHVKFHLSITFGFMAETPSTCEYSRLDARCTRTGETTDVQLKKSCFVLKDYVNFEYALTMFLGVNRYLQLLV